MKPGCGAGGVSLRTASSTAAECSYRARQSAQRSKCSSSDLRPRACSLPSRDRKSTRLNSSHLGISYAVFCLKKKKKKKIKHALKKLILKTKHQQIRHSDHIIHTVDITIPYKSYIIDTPRIDATTTTTRSQPN